MGVQEVAMYYARCDACSDCTDLCYTIPEAVSEARFNNWSILSDGRLVCTKMDGVHREMFDGLLPPEPVMQVPGQLDIDGNEVGEYGV